MSTRLGVGALLVVVSLMLVTTMPACKQSAGSKESPSGWRNFVLAPWESSGPIGSIEEMERIAGFAFVFPSYLPEGMDDKLMVDGSEGGSGTENGVARKWGPQEEVGIPRGEPDSPNITINEMAEPFPGGFPDWTNETEHVTIAATDVGCSAYPSQSNDPLNPMLICDWLVGDRGFHITFQWAVEQAIAGYVTEEMRQEALKVVESMIVAPEHP